LTLHSQPVTEAKDLNFTFSVGSIGQRTQTEVEVVVRKEGGKDPSKGSYAAKAYLTSQSEIVIPSAAVAATSVMIPETAVSEDDTEDDPTEADSVDSSYSLLEGDGDSHEGGAVIAIAVILVVVALLTAAGLIYFYLKTSRTEKLRSLKSQEVLESSPPESEREVVKLDTVDVTGVAKET
jgi:hypothetical protein